VLLFTDVVMPGPVTSRAMAEQGRRLVPGIAVLFTSGHTQNSIVHNGELDAGINLISKPWEVGELARRLRGVPDAARPASVPPGECQSGWLRRHCQWRRPAPSASGRGPG